MTPVTILPRPSFIGSDSLRDLPEAAPEMSDIYSLACIFLDILTFMIKGKLNDFIRFRSTRISLPNNKHKVRTDSSFHCDPDKIDAWMVVLRNESERHSEPIYRSVPELLNLIRMMMAQNAHLRPSALEVRDHIRDTMRAQSGIETLCCLDRDWATPVLSDSMSQIQHCGRRDSGSVVASSPKNASSRRGSDCADHVSVLSRTGSANAARRGSTASTATAKIGAWRKVFSRAA